VGVGAWYYISLWGLRPNLLRIELEPHFSRFAQMSFQLPADVNLDSPQIKVMNEWKEGFLKMDIDILGKCLHKDFRRVVYPRSLGEPVQSKEEWVKEIGGILVFTTAFEVG
jgi:hypothetical protein